MRAFKGYEFLSNINIFIQTRIIRVPKTWLNDTKSLSTLNSDSTDLDHKSQITL
jgi:hypothetical protein